MKAERLREIAAEMEEEIRAMPAVEDAATDKERSRRDEAIRAADARRHAVARAAQVCAKSETELADRLRWRDHLLEASRELEERLLAARAAAAASPPSRRRSGSVEGVGLHAGSAIEAALCSIDHHRCRRSGCAWVGREPETEVRTDAAGSRHLACPACGSDVDAPVLLHDEYGTRWTDPDVLALLPARPNWPPAPNWTDNLRLIANLERRIAEALARVEVVTQGRRRRAA